MTHCRIRLYCDACAAQLGETADIEDRTPARADIEALRLVARDGHGWRRMRPAGRDAYGDYCRACADLMGTKRRRRARKAQ